MKNLLAEMIRYGVSASDIQKTIGCSTKTVRNKLDGVSVFSVTEAIKIRDIFFPGLRVEYLFAQANEIQDTEQRGA